MRNIIAHKGTHITLDALNQIKSIAKDVFERHFLILVDENLDRQLNPIKDIFTNFLDFTNEFALNTTKFIFEQKDLHFLGFKMTYPKSPAGNNRFKKLRGEVVFFLHHFLLNLVRADRVSASKTANS